MKYCLYLLYIFCYKVILLLSKNNKLRVGNSNEFSIMTKENAENKCFAKNIAYTEILSSELLILGSMHTILKPPDQE